MIWRRCLSTSTLPPTIRQLLSSHCPEPDVPLRVQGWVKSVRRQKNVAFAIISDGSSEKGLQAVFTDVGLAKSLTNGSSVRLGGILLRSPGKGQDRELRVESMEVLGDCDQAAYPIQKKSLSVEYLRDHSHLRARTDAIASMLRLRDSASKALHSFFEDQGFCLVHTPIMTSNDCEGAGETFQITSPSTTASTSQKDTSKTHEFFGHPAYLTVSSQLHLEALATAISRVYTLSPCFRAERSQTNRHLAEFWMLEAEWAFTESVHDVCNVVEAALKDVLEKTAHRTQPLVKHSDQDDGSAGLLEQLERARSIPEWTRISYQDAIAELTKYQASTRKFHFEPAWGKPLQSEHERWIAEHVANGPVFVTDYPASLKPFYMRLSDDGRTVACFDLLVPGLGELVGGSLREERGDLLADALERHGLDKEPYEWYLDLRKYGGAPHGGFGLGFERLISWIGGVDNVRECIAMPRWAGRMLL